MNMLMPFSTFNHLRPVESEIVTETLVYANVYIYIKENPFFETILQNSLF